MPLDTTQFLSRQGWRGQGVPLDGEHGRGLKRPIVIPQKRSLGGIGNNRDRAVEWWDDVFAAGAKALAARKATEEKERAELQGHEICGRRSLASLAKREHARRQLMSGFVRGEVIGTTHESEERSTKRAAASADATADATRVQAMGSARPVAATTARPPTSASKVARRAEKAARRAEKEARRAAKEARRHARAEKRQKKERKKLAKKRSSTS